MSVPLSTFADQWGPPRSEEERVAQERASRVVQEWCNSSFGTGIERFRVTFPEQDQLRLKKSITAAILGPDWKPPPPPAPACAVCGWAGKEENGVLVHASKKYPGHSFKRLEDLPPEKSFNEQKA